MKARRKPSGARASAAKKTAAAPRARTKVATPAVAKRRSANAAGKTSGNAPGKGLGKNQSKSAVEALGTDCTIEHATSIHKRLAKIVGNRAPVTLDLGAVKRCDTVGLQILVAFVRERREAGREVELHAASDTVVCAAKLLGLSAMLGFAGSDAQVGHA